MTEIYFKTLNHGEKIINGDWNTGGDRIPYGVPAGECMKIPASAPGNSDHS